MNLVAEFDLFNKNTIPQVAIQITALSSSVLLDLSPQSRPGVFDYLVTAEGRATSQRGSVTFEGVRIALQEHICQGPGACCHAHCLCHTRVSLLKSEGA